MSSTRRQRSPLPGYLVNWTSTLSRANQLGDSLTLALISSPPSLGKPDSRDDGPCSRLEVTVRGYYKVIVACPDSPVP